MLDVCGLSTPQPSKHIYWKDSDCCRVTSPTPHYFFCPCRDAQSSSASAFPLYFTAGPSVRQKREAFNKEREGIIKDTEALFRLRKKQASAAKAQVI